MRSEDCKSQEIINLYFELDYIYNIQFIIITRIGQCKNLSSLSLIKLGCYVSSGTPSQTRNFGKYRSNILSSNLFFMPM